MSAALGQYVAGRSVLHRAPAAVKLLTLVALGVGTLWLDRWWHVAAALAVVLLGYPVARVRVRTMLAQVRPLLWILLAIGVFQFVAAGWERAVVVTGQLVVLVLAAGLVTVTTRTTALLDVTVAATRPLRRFGVDPERVGLLLALGVRAVPTVASLAAEVRDAQRARGLTFSPRAFAVPLLVRSLRRADDLGEALAARGVDD
ncbi:MAG: energy-coupling factor transporter transmembrane protein EcfT [Streptosporangiales bacterium]|nr:energy-coupling factor transporter transmembrane protein EcfT [Streptosporangiales bacterium]